LENFFKRKLQKKNNDSESVNLINHFENSKNFYDTILQFQDEENKNIVHYEATLITLVPSSDKKNLIVSRLNLSDYDNIDIN
jgi:hypothetical protein